MFWFYVSYGFGSLLETVFEVTNEGGIERDLSFMKVS